MSSVEGKMTPQPLYINGSVKKSTIFGFNPDFCEMAVIRSNFVVPVLQG